MGKETKIGVSVILILLCVLAGVVAMRMTRSKPTLLTTAAPEAGKPAPTQSAKPAVVDRPATVVVTGNKPSGWASASDSAPPLAQRLPAKPPAASYMPDPGRAFSRFSALAPPAPRTFQTGTTLALRPVGEADAPAEPPAQNPLRAPTPPSAATAAALASYGSSASAPPAPMPTHGYHPHHRYGSSSALEPPHPPARSVSMAGTVPDAAPKPAQGPRPDGKYHVQPSDNYWRISEKLYGTGAYFKALAEHNRDRIGRADRLLPGTALATPPVKELEEKYPDLCPKPSHLRPAASRFANVSSGARLAGRRTYKVESGDTLYDIAKHELGNPGRWGEIYELNRDVLGDDYDYLSPGLELVLPGSPRPDTLTRNPEEVLRR